MLYGQTFSMFLEFFDLSEQKNGGKGIV